MRLLRSLKSYRKEWLGRDVLAGVIVAALTIPVAMGYAGVAGLPPIYGLYTSIIGSIVYAFLASSPDMIVGLDAPSSALFGSILFSLGIGAGTDEAIAFVGLVGLVTGVFLLLFALLKLGRMVNYVSRPVIEGFITGIALSIVAGQIPRMLGIRSVDGFLSNFRGVIVNWMGINWLGAGMGLMTIGLIIIGRKTKSKLPVVLTVLVFMTVLSYFFKFDEWGIEVIGAIPQGLPQLVMPQLTNFNLLTVIGVGFLMAVLIFTDALLAVNNFGIKNKYRVNDNQELLALGVGGVASSLWGAPPVAASVSRTAANNRAGGKTQVVQVTAALIILLIIVVFNQSLYYIPRPVLAGIVIMAVWGIIDFSPFRLFREEKNYAELGVWLVAVLGTFLVGALVGIFLALILSFLNFIIRTAQPPQAFLGQIPGRDGYFDLARNRKAKPISGKVIYRFSAPLFFANSDYFVKNVKEAVKAEKVAQVFIFEMSGVNSIDHTAQLKLIELLKFLKEKKIKYIFAGLIGNVRDQIEMNSGLRKLIPQTAMIKTLDEAIHFD